MNDKRLKRIVGGLLALLYLLSSVGCSYVALGCTAFSCASCTPNEIKEQISEQVSETIKDELTGKVPQLGDLLDKTTPKPTEESQKDTGNPQANEAFLALDREIFTWYVTDDITMLDQFCYDPSSFGIDESAVPVILGDLSEEHHSEWIAACRRWLDRLHKFDAESLGEQYRFAYDNYVRFFENEIEVEDLFYYSEPLEEYVGVHLNLPLLFGLYTFRDKTDIEHYLTLLTDTERYFSQVLAIEQKRAELGVFMTETALDAVLSDINQVIANRKTSFLQTTIREALDDADWLTEDEKLAYYTQNDELISTVYTDAYKTLRDGLEALRPYCREAVGAKALGNEALRYFTHAIRTESGNDWTIDEAIEFLEKSAMDLYYPLMAANNKSSGKKDNITTGTIEGDERYLKTLITDIVPPMPSVERSFRIIPPELQKGFSPAAYLVPPVDHFSENTILINPTAKTNLLTLAHEGYPGHMYQYTYQYSLGTLPMFQMAIAPIGYAEGWANNAEYSVAKRADMFGAADCMTSVLNNNLSNLIVLMASLLVNGKGATKEDVKAYLTEWGMEGYLDRIYEIAVDMPIYYCKYVMGFCRQYEITEECRQIFDYKDKDFYKEYLSWGPGSFDLLEEKMLAWANMQAEK